jgi:hypothetical protein
MAAPTNTPLTGEIWHLSIDDLLAPLPESARLGGSGPFVINLSASTTPIALPAKAVADCHHAHVYQVQRMEDRRMRYRLRLGPFATEDEAEAILKQARDIYPGALTATADADDLRAIATLRAKAGALPSPMEKPPAPIEKPPEKLAVAPVSLPPAPQAALSQPAAKPPVSAVPTVSVTPTLYATPTAPAIPTVSAALIASARPTAPAIPTVSAALKVSAAPTAPATPTVPAALKVSDTPIAPAIPTVSAALKVSATAVPPMPTVSAPAMPKVSPPMAAAEQKVPVRVPAAIPTLNAPIPRQSEQLSARVPNLDATQTVRALTPLELEDDSASRWFVIQLSLAEDPFDPDTLPNLDIFSVYRLYSVAGIDQGRIMHALRLGFFTEEIAADAVASYLASFYDKPTIRRVSSAERERFAEQSLEPRKDVGATGKHAAIEITSERFVREKRSGQAAAK